MVKARRRRGGIFRVERGALAPPERCNHALGAYHKGWFTLGDGTRCDPLTVKWTQREFHNVFRRYGLPEIIRVDSGSPFAAAGPGGSCKLSVWWIGLGIEVHYSRRTSMGRYSTAARGWIQKNDKFFLG